VELYTNLYLVPVLRMNGTTHPRAQKKFYFTFLPEPMSIKTPTTIQLILRYAMCSKPVPKIYKNGGLVVTPIIGCILISVIFVICTMQIA
jgi:hypothetical protein